MRTPAKPAHPRVPEIDGLRGWACVSVMMAHLFFGVFTNADPSFIAPDWRWTMEPFLGGTIAVAVFFILSGDVLSASYWATQSQADLVRHAVKRYARLTIPVLAACSVVFALLKCGLTFHREAGRLLHVEDWLGGMLSGTFTVADLVWFSCFRVYFDYPTERAFIPFLWIVRFEMMGSLLVLVYLFSDSLIRRKTASILFIMVVCAGAGSILACFPVGMLLGRIRVGGGFARLRGGRIAETAAVAGFVLALVVGTYSNRVWQGFLLPSIVAGTVVVACVYSSRTLAQLFASTLSLWLGRVSFPIFLLHFPVIISFTSGMVLLAHAHGGLTPGIIWAIALASAGVCLTASRLFLPVEALSARLGNRTCELAMRERAFVSLK